MRSKPSHITAGLLSLTMLTAHTNEEIGEVLEPKKPQEAEQISHYRAKLMELASGKKSLNQAENPESEPIPTGIDPKPFVLRQEKGGYVFDASKIPGMESESPMAEGEVFMSFPKPSRKTPRVIFYFHGNGGQNFGQTNNRNVVRYSSEMQKAGDPVILIMPQDMKGNLEPEKGHFEGEGYKTVPGNWADYNDFDTLANIIAFAEKVAGQSVGDITLSSFSGGNLGTMKTLRALEKAKKINPEAASLYERINRIAYFDSATGMCRMQVARWMAADSDNRVSSSYTHRKDKRKTPPGKYGTELIRTEAAKLGVSPSRFRIEQMEDNEGHGVYRDYFKRYTAQ